MLRTFRAFRQPPTLPMSPRGEKHSVRPSQSLSASMTPRPGCMYGRSVVRSGQPRGLELSLRTQQGSVHAGSGRETATTICHSADAASDWSRPREGGISTDKANPSTRLFAVAPARAPPFPLPPSPLPPIAGPSHQDPGRHPSPPLPSHPPLPPPSSSHPVPRSPPGPPFAAPRHPYPAERTPLPFEATLPSHTPAKTHPPLPPPLPPLRPPRPQTTTCLHLHHTPPPPPPVPPQAIHYACAGGRS